MEIHYPRRRVRATRRATLSSLRGRIELARRRSLPDRLLDAFAGIEVRGVEQRTELDHRLLAVLQVDTVRSALGPLDRLGQRLDFEQRVARDHLLGFGERAIDHRALATAVLHPRAAAGRREAAEIEQHAGLLQLLVEVVHRHHGLLGRWLGRFGLLGCDSQQHDLHRWLLVTRSVYPSRRSARRRIDNRDAFFSAGDLARLGWRYAVRFSGASSRTRGGTGTDPRARCRRRGGPWTPGRSSRS